LEIARSEGQRTGAETRANGHVLPRPARLECRLCRRLRPSTQAASETDSYFSPAWTCATQVPSPVRSIAPACWPATRTRRTLVSFFSARPSPQIRTVTGRGRAHRWSPAISSARCARTAARASLAVLYAAPVMPARTGPGRARRWWPGGAAEHLPARGRAAGQLAGTERPGEVPAGGPGVPAEQA
jgi:hypothetical protein